ncbi:sensor histidine kinase [Algibacillus agarilyticus]|uniref:sensor histidine kinase n=1 Tax=Algibacillus agarilyticus TaxID=2234133 RepID=UPI000DCFF407|nr:sensor histidine kinase [Algibacillus agarilyticus]
MENNGKWTRLKKIDAFLLPRNINKQSMPYVWLVYLPFFFAPVFYFSSQYSHWLYTVVASLIFLILYFRSYWVSSKHVFNYICLLVCLATVCTLYTVSALTLFIYAAAFCCRLPSQKYAFMALFGLVFWLISISIIFTLSPYFYLPGIPFTLIIGLVNIYQVALQEKNKALLLSQDETKRLAKIAERERIARDLHDLVGHTFSVITLKADLAGRLLNKGVEHNSAQQADNQITHNLINQNIEKARLEIKQLEDISRDALSQVREVVSGYRSSDLMSELANAKYVLASVDIEFNYQLNSITPDELALDLYANKELAIVLRELVTNIIKHAQATLVNAQINHLNDTLILTVEDNGKGFKETQSPGLGLKDLGLKGFGLKGIEERIQQMAGHVSVKSNVTAHENQGTKTTISIPYGIKNERV